MDATSLRETLEAIVSFGPRGPGTPAESRAAAWVAERLRAEGLEVAEEPFEASWWPFRLAATAVPLVGAVLVAAATAAFPTRPGLCLALVAIVLLLAGATARGGRALRFLFDAGRRVASVNVVARSRDRDDRRPTVLLVAHHDTKSRTLSLGAQLGIVLAALLSTATLGALALFDGPPLAAAITGGLAVLSLAVLGLSGTGNRSPGALDNGSGLALVLALAREVPARLRGKANLIVLSTGAEELGMCGALRFAERHRGGLSRESLVALNFDTLGARGPVLHAGDAAGHGALLRDLREALAARGIGFAKIPLLLGAGMDHQPLNAAGLPTVSLTQALGPAALVVHRPTDRLDRVDPDLLARVGEAVLAALEAEIGRRVA